MVLCLLLAVSLVVALIVFWSVLCLWSGLTLVFSRLLRIPLYLARLRFLCCAFLLFLWSIISLAFSLLVPLVLRWLSLTPRSLMLLFASSVYRLHYRMRHSLFYVCQSGLEVVDFVALLVWP